MPEHSIITPETERAMTPQMDGEGRAATVLQVLPAMGSQGGVERGTVEIAEAIVNAGGRAIVASAGGPLEHDLKRVGAEHVTLPLATKNPLKMRANAKKLAQLIRAEGVDIVHARSRAPAWSAYWACKETRAHLVTTFHGTYGRANFLKTRYNAIMTKGERVIAISRFIAGHMMQYYGVSAHRIRIIHRGVDISRFDPDAVSTERVVALATKWRLPDGAPVVMLPGRLTRWKGQIVCIEAMARLERKNIRCLLVGSDQGRAGYRRELEDLIEARGLSDVVHIIDDCRDMAAAYMLTDVVISASTDPEAFGRVVTEAQAMGRPVVASDHGGAKETVIPGETGWLTPAGDADALAAAIRKVLDISPDARAALSKRAIEHVRAHFSKETMCAKTLAVYDEVLQPTARR